MSDAMREMVTAQQKVIEMTSETAKLKRAIRWLHEAYMLEAGIPLEVLEGSLVHLPVIEAVSREG